MFKHRYVISLLAATLLVAAPSQAQSTPDDSRLTLAVTGGATVGDESGATLGAEVAVRLARFVDLAVAGTWLQSVTSSDVASRAEIIGGAVGAAATPTQTAAAFDAAIRVRWPAGRAQPYALAGAGAVRVQTDTTFARNGNDVAAAALGVALGRDLSGSFTTPVWLAGGGVEVLVNDRTTIDMGVRYHRHFAEPASSYQRVSIVRVQVAAGIRF